MRFAKGLLVCAIAAGWLAACSDDTTPVKKDKGAVDLTVHDSSVDSSVDNGTDSTPPQPDSAPDQVVKQDQGPTVDGPKADGPTADRGPTVDQGKKDTGAGTPDQGPNPDQGGGTNGTCANAQQLTLVSGAVTVNGNTTGVADEFSGLTCGGYAMTGGQLYYKFNATKDQWYKVLLTSTFAYAYAIVFTSPTCTEASIQTDCQSNGATGTTAEYASSGKTRAGYFKAPATGTVFVAVDSEGAVGPFTLSIETLAAVANGTCANATALTLFNGKATLRGDIGPTLTPNEFGTDIDCGGFSAYDEAQAYYKLTATAGQAYKISVKSDSAGWLYSYIFRAASCSTSASVNTDCSSAGATGAVTSSYAENGASITYVFAAATAGDYVIAVDTKYPEDYGGFTLTVEAFTPPANGTCAAATAVTLTAGKATVNGSTLGTTDQYATADCGGFSSFDGPQAYYEFVPAAGKYYKVTLNPTFLAYAYWFQKASCGTVASINGNCSSAGVTGGYMGSISSGSASSMIISNQSAPLLIAVDSTDASDAGDFALTIEEVVPPANDSCATAQALTFTSGKATATGDTTLATGTLDQSCAGGTPGKDLFYSIPVTAGRLYQIAATPSTGYDVAIYLLDGCATPTCLQGADDTGTGKVETLSLTATTTGNVIVGVDSWTATSSSGTGSFVLDVTEITSGPPTGLVLHEINVGAVDYVAIKNKGTAAVNLAGVQIVLREDGYPTPDVRFNLPAQMLAAGATLFLPESGPKTGEVQITSIPFVSSTDFVALLCFGQCTETSAANVLDAALFGTVATSLPTGVVFTGGAVGGLTSANEDTTSYVRAATAGVAPNFLASDWTTGANTRP